MPEFGFWVPHIRHHLFMTKNVLPSHAPGLLLAFAFGYFGLRSATDPISPLCGMVGCDGFTVMGTSPRMR